MKRLISLLLALSTVLVACGGKSATTPAAGGLPADAAAHEQLRRTLGSLVAHPAPAKK